MQLVVNSKSDLLPTGFVQKIRKYKEYVDPEDKDKQTDVKVLKDDTDSSKSDDSDNSKTDTSEETKGNTTTKVTTKTTDETQQDNQNKVSYSIQDVLDHWLKNNKLGFTYEVIGDFEKKELEELQDGTGADMLSKTSLFEMEKEYQEHYFERLKKLVAEDEELKKLRKLQSKKAKIEQ